MLDGSWATDTVRVPGRYGLIIWTVWEQRLICSTVLTTAGVNTTVFMTRTFPSVATAVAIAVI